MEARSAPVFDGSVPPTILIIDDEAQIRRAVKNTFQAAGAKVIEAATGSEGIDRAAAERPDLIILDLGLPDIAGADVCREIRKWAGAPILVLSARHSDEEKVALLDAGRGRLRHQAVQHLPSCRHGRGPCSGGSPAAPAAARSPSGSWCSTPRRTPSPGRARCFA